MSFEFTIGTLLGRSGVLSLIWLSVILITRAGLRNFGYYGWHWQWYKIFFILFVLSFVLVLFTGDNHKVSVVNGILIIIAAPSAIIFWLASLLFKKKRIR